MTQVKRVLGWLGVIYGFLITLPSQTLRLTNDVTTTDPLGSTPSDVISHVQSLRQCFRSFSVDSNKTHARYAALLATALDNVASTQTKTGLLPHQRHSMLRQLPWFLLQKTLWPMGTASTQ